MAYTSKIANHLLITPFDNKSAVREEISKRLTEEEFFRHCYSKPMFEQNPVQYMKEEYIDKGNDSPTDYDEIDNQIHQQQVSFNNFETWLDNYENNKVYTINGNAGTGKTTFINHKKYTETKIKWIILDIHRARSFDEWITDIRTDIEDFTQAKSKVYGSIMNKLWELIFQGLDEDGNYSLEVVYQRLASMYKKYQEKYAEKYPSGRKLFDDIGFIIRSEDTVLDKVETAANIFRSYIDGRVGKRGEGIIEALNILLLTLRCLMDDDDDRYLIAFDNFERFIAKDELLNKDVDEIRLLLTSYIERINQAGNCHRHHFKFAMAVRDSTARMCGVRLHASDAEPSNLDVGKWYDTQDIIKLKKDWYADNNISIENSDIIEQITGDSRICGNQTITGLKLLIDPLFNDNKRLIIDFIGTMVELPGNEKGISAYRTLWNEDTSFSRFAARSIIRGMILNELERKPDKLFAHIKTYSANSNKNGVGDARKILTILYNNSFKGNNDEMPLSTVLSELYHVNDIERIWGSKENAEKRKSICEVLFYMNSYNRRENDWLQFIDLQFKDINGSITVQNPDILEQILSQNMKKCTIHLMPAGRAYLMYIVASFEFFSLRYSREYRPLYTLIPTPDEMKRHTAIISLPCYVQIECVVKYAIKCIELLISGEDTIKLYMNSAKDGIFHHIRIINQHREYIKGFARYIRDKYCYSEDIEESVKNRYTILYKRIIGLSNLYNAYTSDGNRQLGRM